MRDCGTDFPLHMGKVSPTSPPPSYSSPRVYASASATMPQSSHMSSNNSSSAGGGGGGYSGLAGGASPTRYQIMYAPLTVAQVRGEDKTQN